MPIKFSVLETSFFNSFPIAETVSHNMFIYIRKGRLKLYVNKTDYILGPGCGLIVSEGLGVTSQSESFSLEGVLIRFCTEKPLRLPYGIFVNSSPGGSLRLIANKMFGCTPDKIHTLSVNFLSEAVPYAENHIKILSKSRSLNHSDAASVAKDFIDANYEKDITIYDAAKHCGITRNHLHNLFCTSYGIAPKRYLINRRIEKAKILLETSDESSRHIAFAVGFASPQRFNESFKNITGVSPLEFRARSRE